MGWKSGKPREELDWTFFPNKEIEAGYLLSPVGGGGQGRWPQLLCSLSGRDPTLIIT